MRTLERLREDMNDGASPVDIATADAALKTHRRRKDTINQPIDRICSDALRVCAVLGEGASR